MFWPLWARVRQAALMAACPDATLIAHPRAARHAIDPSKLVASASAVYGEEQFRELYGVIDPIPEKRVRTMDDGEQLEFAGTPLHFTHTRGHANHHFVIYDPDEKAIFTGDAFGLCYPDLCRDGLFALPSTSPTDFDGPLARDAVQVILETGAETAYPTHFGPVREMEEMARQVTAHLERSEALMLEAKASDLPDDQLEGWIRPRLDAHFAAALGDTDTARDPQTWKRLEMDLALNAQGLAFVAAKKRRKEAEASSS